MSEWLDEVIANHGVECGRCKVFRLLKGNEIERCPDCLDEPYDVYEVEAQAEELP